MSGDDRTTAIGLLSAGLDRLRARPDIVAGFLLAGGAVTGVDLLRAESPVPAGSDAGGPGLDVRLEFWILVTILRQTGFAPGALVDLQLPWLAVTVGLELFSLVSIVTASYGSLCVLLDSDPALGAALRYGAVLVALATVVPDVSFGGASAVFGILLLVVLLSVVVRLVPLPGRLAYGESLRTALGRSWAQTEGHAWSLFGVVLALGLANYLLVSLPLVGAVGSSAVAAVHAAVVATFLDRTGWREPVTSAVSSPTAPQPTRSNS